jgi:hypothetical protein
MHSAEMQRRKDHEFLCCWSERAFATPLLDVTFVHSDLTPPDGDFGLWKR